MEGVADESPTADYGSTEKGRDATSTLNCG